MHSTGPGGYSPKAENVKQTDPAWSFGKQAKVNDKWIDSPGPGNYETTPSMNWTMGVFAKHERKNDCANSVPGPGNYESNSLFK